MERFSNPYIKIRWRAWRWMGPRNSRRRLEGISEHFKGCCDVQLDVLALAFAAFLRCCATSTYDNIAPSPDITIDDPKKKLLEPLATDALRCCVQEKASGGVDVGSEDDWRAKGEQATSSFLSCVFGKGVEDFSELSRWSTSTSRHWCSGVCATAWPRTGNEQ